METNSGTNAIERLLARIIAVPICLLLSAWCMTLSRQTEELSKIDRMIEQGHRVQVMFWHGKYLPLFALARGRDVVVLTMDSFRGNVIANVCRWFGYKPVKLPVRGHGLQLLATRYSNRNRLYAVALDGPLGPYHRIRHGALQLAMQHGIRLVPIEVQSERKWVLASRWDKQEIPLPFSKISIAVGDMMDLDDTPTGSDHGMFDQKITTAMNAQFHRANDLL